MRAAFEQHAITQRLAPHVLAEWHAWATDRVKAFQRASSAVEGRNGFLSQMHHNQRGLPKQRYKVWTVLHNFDCRAADGTTPAVAVFQADVSRTSLKRCYRMSKTCLGRDNDNQIMSAKSLRA